jgi:hypothetical protein
MFVDCLLRRRSCGGTIHIQREVPNFYAKEGNVVLVDGAAWMIVRVGQIVQPEDSMAVREQKLASALSL